MAKRRISFIPDDVPMGLKPIYPMSAANEPIKLYDGEIELEQGKIKFSGSGSIKFDWLPRPGFRFVLDISKQEHSPQLEDGTLHLLGMGWHAKVTVLGTSVSFEKGAHQAKGIVNEFEIGQDQDVTSVIFHVVNFVDNLGSAVRDEKGTKTWLSRSVMEAGEWRITIDKIENYRKIFDNLKETGGFAITHVGKLERLDGGRFSGNKSAKLFEALFRYLSFCRGSWVAPILPIGFDANGARVWEIWRAWKIERWRYIPTWFNGASEEGLSKGFPGFYRLWVDEMWKESLLLSNHWYVESNMTAGGVEGSIILSQAAFELLGWAHLVEDRMALSEKGYEKLDAADKMRLLLSTCGIPALIPPSLSTLTSSARLKENQWKDGPQALTEIRNALVHSNPAKRKKVFDENMTLVHEAWELSLWYLELILLKAMGYLGNYSNRIARVEWKGQEVEKVPWV
jgi:hypothetical protein